MLNAALLRFPEPSLVDLTETLLLGLAARSGLVVVHFRHQRAVSCLGHAAILSCSQGVNWSPHLPEKALSIIQDFQ